MNDESDENEYDYYRGAIAELRSLLAGLVELSELEARMAQQPHPESEADLNPLFLWFSILWAYALKQGLLAEAFEIANRWEIFINPRTSNAFEFNETAFMLASAPPSGERERIGVTALWEVDLVVLTRIFGWRQLDDHHWVGPLEEDTEVLPVLVAPPPELSIQPQVCQLSRALVVHGPLD